MRLYGLLLMLGLMGCSTTEPQRSTYLLRYADVPVTSDQASPQLGIRQLIVASYISGSGLVLETAPGEVNRARYHLWAEPLRESLRGYLADAITVHSGQPVASEILKGQDRPLNIDMTIDQFHGDAQGQAVLAVRWRLVNQDDPQNAKEYRWIQRHEIPRDGYAALVESQKVLLDSLAQSIAAEVNK